MGAVNPIPTANEAGNAALDAFVPAIAWAERCFRGGVVWDGNRQVSKARRLRLARTRPGRTHGPAHRSVSQRWGRRPRIGGAVATSKRRNHRANNIT
jgi:hypothetical protein